MAFTPLPTDDPLTHRWAVDPAVNTGHLYHDVFPQALKAAFQALSETELIKLRGGFSFLYGRFDLTIESMEWSVDEVSRKCDSMTVDTGLRFEARVLPLNRCNFEDHRALCDAIAQERILCQLDTGGVRHLLWCDRETANKDQSFDIRMGLIMRDKYDGESEADIRAVEQDTSIIVLRHLGWKALHNL